MSLTSVWNKYGIKDDQQNYKMDSCSYFNIFDTVINFKSPEMLMYHIEVIWITMGLTSL